MEENNREPYGPSQWSTTKNSKEGWRENSRATEQCVQRNTSYMLSYSGTSLGVLKGCGAENRAVSQEASVQAFPVGLCSTTSDDLHLHKDSLCRKMRWC